MLLLKFLIYILNYQHAKQKKIERLKTVIQIYKYLCVMQKNKVQNIIKVVLYKHFSQLKFKSSQNN